MTDERRKGIADLQVSINELTALMKEIHQRQNEVTLPTLKKLNECLYGNGKKGLLFEHESCMGKIGTIDKVKTWFIANLVTLFVAIISFAIGYGGLLKEVNIVMKHLGLQ